MRKIWLAAVGLVMSAWLGDAVLAKPQNATTGGPSAQPAPPPAIPRAQLFAGTVMELDAVHIKVSRTPVGRPTESRSFSITPTTKMNKAAVKLHNHVTVRYTRTPEGDIALEIEPRPIIPRSVPKP